MMKDHDCVSFLQWALPQLHLRWQGMRQVRGQVCKRIQRRLHELALPDMAAYRAYLISHAEEWIVLDECCRITISRFYRDRAVFDALRQTILPELAQQAMDRGDSILRCWSAGCASGEEAYTLKILWELGLSPQFSNLWLQVTATDIDAHLLERAQVGCYAFNSVKELPAPWLTLAFDQTEQGDCVRTLFRAGIEFLQQDIRTQMP
jgi:chemotaxis protein methyltransferase CheR